MRRATRWALLLVGLALLATAGCGPDGRTPDQAGGTGPGPSPSGPSPSAAPAPDAVLVDFGRQGGFVGVSDHLVVREDGGYTLVRSRPPVNRSGQLDPGELADLRAALVRSGFTGLPHVQPGHGADLLTYHLSYHGTEILAQDGAVAEPLAPVIDLLSRIVERTGS